jgi:hypothetical protein
MDRDKPIIGKLRMRYASTPKPTHSDDVFTKGLPDAASLSFSVSDIKARLNELYKSKDLQIKSLTGDNQTNFSYIVSHIRALYNTDEYVIFYGLVKDVFGGLKDFQVGTVGAYFSGCMNRTGSENSGCSLLCAGSLPIPRNEDGEDNTCQYPVVLAVYNNGKYVFAFLHNLKVRENTIVYIQDTEEFRGFSAQEIQSLQNWGVANVSINQITNDGKSSEPVTDEFVPLSSLQTRAAETGSVKQRQLSSSQTVKLSTGEIVAIALIVVFSVILLLILGFHFYRRK